MWRCDNLCLSCTRTLGKSKSFSFDHDEEYASFMCLIFFPCNFEPSNLWHMWTVLGLLGFLCIVFNWKPESCAPKLFAQSFEHEEKNVQFYQCKFCMRSVCILVLWMMTFLLLFASDEVNIELFCWELNYLCEVLSYFEAFFFNIDTGQSLDIWISLHIYYFFLVFVPFHSTFIFWNVQFCFYLAFHFSLYVYMLSGCVLWVMSCHVFSMLTACTAFSCN